MKKVVSVVLVALMVLGLSVTAFAADGKVTVVADKTEAKAGETVVLTIKGEGFDKVGSLGLMVAVDDKLELADKGEWLITGMLAEGFDANNLAAFMSADVADINTEIFKMSVKVKDGTAAGSYNVKVTLLGEGGVTLGETTYAVVVPAPHTEHTWDEGKVTTPATCKDEGVKTYTCTVCNATKTEAIPKLTEHTWDEGKVTTPATCKDEGVKTYTCTVCGETKTEAIAKLTEHTWDAGKVTKEATTEAEGEKTYTCTVCGATKTEVIEKLPVIPTGDNNVVAVVFLSTLALVAVCGVVVASKKRVND